MILVWGQSRSFRRKHFFHGVPTDGTAKFACHISSSFLLAAFDSPHCNRRFPGRLKGVIAIQEESRPKGCRLSSILSYCFGETACEESTSAFSACSHALEHRAGKLKAVR